MSNDLLDVIETNKEGSQNWSESTIVKRKIWVRDIIINRLDEKYHKKILNIREPVEILKRLRSSRKSEVNVTHTSVRTRLYAIRMNKDETVNDFCDRFDAIVREYESCEDVIELTAQEIRSAFYQAVSSVIPELRNADLIKKQATTREMTLDEIKSFILQLEAEKKMETKEAPKVQRVQSLVTKESRCYQCNKIGHCSKDCPLKDQNIWFCYYCQAIKSHKGDECPGLTVDNNNRRQTNFRDRSYEQNNSRDKEPERVRRAKEKLDEEQGDSEERVAIVREGTCKVGICGSDAACQPFPNNTYTCLCPHDSAPPTANGRCPRYTVPLLPHRIPNIRPPEDNPADVQNKTKPTNHNTTSWIPPAESSYSGRKSDSTNLIIAASVVSTIIFFLIIILWRKRKRCASREKSSPSPSPIVLKRSLLVAERYAPNPQYSACTGSAVPVLRRETLKFLNEIGEGCFGKVFKGELHTENDGVEVVAIKVLKETASREAEEDFLREVDIMSAFRHSNILPLLGVVLRDSNVTPMMVFEYMPHGDLAEVLRGQRKHASKEDLPNLTPKDLLLVALQIANGMKYLAAQRFVHRDLACRNCLVADGPIVKIADFGMSRDVYTCDYYKIGGSRLLPVRWMSPESVMYGRFTLESDIWSYGVVLWEIYSFGKQPYYGHTNEEVVKLILQGIMLIPPEDCPSLICELMKCCWKTEPRDRIKFSDIYHKLAKSYENFEEPTTIKFENEFGSIKSFGSLKSCDMKKLPRPPPLPIIPQVDLLDREGYLLPKEIKEPVQYLQALPD